MAYKDSDGTVPIHLHSDISAVAIVVRVKDDLKGVAFSFLRPFGLSSE